MHSGSSTLLNRLFTILFMIGGRKGGNGGGGHIMTCSNYRTLHRSWLWALPFCWAHLAGVLGGENIYLGSINNNKDLSCPFHCHWWVGWDGLQHVGLTCSINRPRHQSHVTVGGTLLLGHLASFIIFMYEYL